MEKSTSIPHPIGDNVARVDAREKVIGAALFAGRIAHGVGIVRQPEDFRFRVGGMMATFTAIGAAALAALIALAIGWG